MFVLVSVNFYADAVVKLTRHLGPQRTTVVLKRELQFTKLKNNKKFKILPRI